jgi:hypothetical protein
LGHVDDSILEALEEGHCTRREIIEFCEGRGISKRSVYKTMAPQKMKKRDDVVKMTIRDERDKEGGYLRQEKRRSTNVFVPWSSALETLFRRVDESSFGDFEFHLRESKGRVFSIEMKSRKDLERCVAKVAIVSCRGKAQPEEIARLSLNPQPSSSNIAEVQIFPFIRIQDSEPRLFVAENGFQYSCPANVALFSLNCKGVFLFLPYFLNLQSDVGPSRILRIERNGVATSFGGE